ncbi:thiamine pyrophosphate-binding protein [Microbacterium awajiense]
MTVADNMVAVLRESGVRRLYGVPGDSLNGLVDALRRSAGIEWIPVRHEEAAALAAGADAALTGRLAVCVGGCGPGSTHLINGLYDAQRNGVPLLAIAAQVPGAEIGGEYFQETHPEESFEECSVYSAVISHPEHAEHIFGMAIRAAVERRGVAVVVVPGEVFLAPADPPSLPVGVQATSPVVRPSDAELRTAAGILDSSSRVTILAGAGCAGARDEVLALAAALQAPIVHTLRGKEILEFDNPYDVGMTGLLGFASGYKAIRDADTILMLGTDFPYRQFLPKRTYIQVDVRGERLGRRADLTLALVGTVRDTVAGLRPLLRAERTSGHLDAACAHYRRARDHLDDRAVADRVPVHPELVARTLSAVAADDAVFTVDAGSPMVWAARSLRMNGKRRLLGSFNHGSMATALPNGIGAKAASSGRQVVAMAGDGGLSLLLGELRTLVQLQLDVKVVVFNDDTPHFADVAAAMGMPSRRVTHVDDLRDAATELLGRDGPALLEVITARQEPAIPPAIAAAQAKGLSLYAIRTILAGRGDELLDLVSTHVARRLLG